MLKNQIRQMVSASEIWDNIIYNAWSAAEPGVLFWDTVIRNSVSNCYGKVDESFYDTACNPCGEIVMGTDSCRLLAINLYPFVENAFTTKASFNFNYFSEIVQKSQRMMDDMIDLEIELIEKILKKIESDPEPEYIKAIEKQTWTELLQTCINGRRTGLGITGLGDALASLGIRYGSDKSIKMTEKIYKTLSINAYMSTCILAKERGTFPIFSFEIEKNNKFLKQVFKASPEVYEIYKKYGRRNVALTTTPPAGTISVEARVTSGIEPTYLIKYTRRKKINPNDKNVKIDFVDELGDSWQEFDVMHKGFTDWMKVTGETEIEKSPYYKATSADINWEASVDLQAAAQKWICHAISKTCNLPKDASQETVNQVYMRAWEKGCKGFTVYRDGCRSGVLVEKKKDLDNLIQYHNAPKRPKELPCDVFHVSVMGHPYFILVGTLFGQPYEIFAGDDKDNTISRSVKKGIIKKHKRGKYGLFSLVDPENAIHPDISAYIGEDFETITRLISSNLRHGCNVGFVVHQLEKTKGDLMSFSKAISRVLKKYIEDGTSLSGEECPECSGSLARKDGCVQCVNCGFSKC